MKTRKSRNNNTEVNQGFSQRDTNYLRKFDNTSADPAIQMFTEKDLEDETGIVYYCSFCKSKLDHLKEGIENTIWRCNNCMEYYDTSIQDMLLKNISSSRVKRYHTWSWNNGDLGSPSDIIYGHSTDNGRTSGNSINLSNDVVDSNSPNIAISN